MSGALLLIYIHNEISWRRLIVQSEKDGAMDVRYVRFSTAKNIITHINYIYQ